MKKIIVFLSTILLFNLVGCENSKLKIAQEVAQEIMEVFVAEDIEALYSLLSHNAQNYPNIREQIREAFDFIDGEIISYELPTDTGGGGKDIKHGKVTHENITPWIENIETDSGKMYLIGFRYDLVFESDKNAEGLGNIMIDLLDERKRMVERLGIGIDVERFPR